MKETVRWVPDLLWKLSSFSNTDLQAAILVSLCSIGSDVIVDVSFRHPMRAVISRKTDGWWLSVQTLEIVSLCSWMLWSVGKAKRNWTNSARRSASHVIDSSILGSLEYSSWCLMEASLGRACAST